VADTESGERTYDASTRSFTWLTPGGAGRFAHACHEKGALALGFISGLEKGASSGKDLKQSAVAPGSWPPTASRPTRRRRSAWTGSAGGSGSTL
jgi:hypothetical protein